MDEGGTIWWSKYFPELWLYRIPPKFAELLKMPKEHNLGVLGKRRKTHKAQLLSGPSDTRVQNFSCCFGKDCVSSLDFPDLSLVYFKIMVIRKGEFHQSADKSLAKKRDGYEVFTGTFHALKS